MKIDNILVVYDPTTVDQPALNRAAVIAEAEGVKVHVYSCIHSDTSSIVDEQGAVAGQEATLAAAVKPLQDKGIAVSTEVEWDKDWYQAVVKAAERNGSDAVLKSSQRHSKGQRRLKKTSDWTLIRDCACPVLLVKSEANRNRRKVLAAIDITGKKEIYGELNDNVLSFCKRYIDADNAEVDFISAHSDLAGRPDRGTLIRTCGVDTSRVHIAMGDPDDVIVAKAEELGVNLVVIGNSARSGLYALMNTNTAEKVLDKLDCDLLALT